MPELPEVETVRRGLAAAMQGARFDRVEALRPDLRWPLPANLAQRLQGNTVVSLGRRAKYLLADLSSAEVLVMHLGMSGSFRVLANGRERLPGRFVFERSRAQTHDHIIFSMSSGATVVFNDPRRFGFMKLVRRDSLGDEPLMRALGPEPLGDDFNAEALARACARRSTSLKAALSDQRVVAGLGNIYVCEALHRARLSPRRPASSIAARSGPARARTRALVQAIRDVLTDAIDAGGSSLRDHRSPDGDLGMFQHDFRVYDREGKPCPRRGCSGTIRRIVQGARSTFYCPRCQR